MTTLPKMPIEPAPWHPTLLPTQAALPVNVLFVMFSTPAVQIPPPRIDAVLLINRLLPTLVVLLTSSYTALP
jgi:hypothetical protein